LADSGYCDERRELLKRHGLNVFAISNHLVGQAVCDRIDERHRSIVPPRVWGDGKPEGVQQRAATEMIDTARAAARLGASVRNGFTGSARGARRTVRRECVHGLVDLASGVQLSAGVTGDDRRRLSRLCKALAAD